MFLSIALNMTSYTTQGSETRKLTIEGGIVLKKTFRLAFVRLHLHLGLYWVQEIYHWHSNFQLGADKEGWNNC
jgi:hypothetical protein